MTGAELLRLDHRDDATVASLEGEVDLANAEEVETRLLEELAGGRSLVVDLTQLTYMDSSGVRLLERLAAQAVGSGTPLALVVAAGTFPEDVLRLVGMLDVLPVHPTVVSALEQ